MIRNADAEYNISKKMQKNNANYKRDIDVAEKENDTNKDNANEKGNLQTM